AASSLFAVNGKANGMENALTGRITVMGKDQSLPMDGDVGGLDPAYDPSTFDSSYACTPDLKRPVSFDCSGAIEPRLAQAAARLTVRNFGALADRLDKDATCGFKSPAVLQYAELQGAVGGMGTVILTARDCALNFAPGTVAKTSCTGSQRKVSGKAVV